jgi:hypothetical protein
MKYLISLLFLLNTAIYANEQAIGADCILLEDENSIICKYTHERVDYDKEVIFHWIEPDGVTTRKRVMRIPSFHGSVYDYRYMKGRANGTWTFKVIDNKKEYSTTFEIKE